MKFKHRRRLVLIGAVACAAQLCVLLGAGSASAASTNPFGCRASVARVNLLTLPSVEPLVANKPQDPCATDTTGLERLNVPSTGTPVLTVGPAGAFTASSVLVQTPTGYVTPGATAFTSVNGVVIPSSQGTIAIVGPAEAIAGYSCTASGQLVSEAYSTLDIIYLNGQAIALPAPGAADTITLGGGSYINVNEKTITPTSITMRILHVHLQGLGDIYVGESIVDHTSSTPCAGIPTGATPSTTTIGGPCPNGTTFDPTRLACVLVVNGQTIVVSSPFKGPTGGTVISLQQARKLYKSPCLSGPGPQYVIVGTNKADRINGTTRAERILGLAGDDRIAGGGGNDCIDGGSGNDKIFAGKGNVRLYGGTGNDRISQQAGNGYIDGGPGNNTIFTGNGNETIYGGGGRDRIGVGRGTDVIYGGKGGYNNIGTGDGNDTVHAYGNHNVIYMGNGKDHVYGGGGSNRIYDPSEVAFVNCGTGKHNTAYVLSNNVGYATAHGCQTVHTVKLKKTR